MAEVVESINRRPEYIEEREKSLLDQIFGKYNEETGEYEGGTMQQPDLFNVPEYRQPGLDPLETKALDLAGSEGFINRYSPYFDKSTEAIGGGLDTMEKGAGYFDDARTSVDAGTGTFDPATATSKFMNPYRQNVIDEAMSQIDRQGQIAQNNISAKAIQAGAFGGSREGIQRAENDRNILSQKSQTIAGLLDKGYGDALKTSLGSFEEEKKRNLEAGRLTGGLGSSLSGVGANMGNVGGTAADVGRVYGSMGPNDLRLMAGLGGGKRAYDAEGIEIARKEAQRPLEEATRPLDYGYAALKGTPSAGIYNTYRPQPAANPFLSGIGAYTAIQGINQA
jgi:hypothetical protein